MIGKSWYLKICQLAVIMEKKKKPISVDRYWRTILALMDCGEVRYPIIGKVVRFVLSNAEANGTIERHFSQSFHIIRKDRNRLETHTIK